MRRYSPSYFIATGIKSFWRNGFMTVASIAVLMSCLVVMGCFALLVYNIDYNLNNIDGLNKIVAFVDVDRIIDAGEETETEAEIDSDTDAAEEQTDEAQLNIPDDGAVLPLDIESENNENGEAITADVETKETSDSAVTPDEAYIDSLFSNFEAQLESFSSFASISEARDSQSSVQLAFDTLSAKLDALDYNSAEIMLRYENLAEKFEYAKTRVSLLTDIETQVMNVSGIDKSQVEFKSKSTALKEQKEEYADYVNLYEALREDDNPLPDSFTISYTDIKGIDLIQWDLEHIDGIYSVVCMSEHAQNIASVKNGVVMIFSWFLVILFVVSIFVIVNTIKIAVHARRDEIGVMRYVGATNFFITAPFVVEGGTIGLISGSIGYLILRYAYESVATRIAENYNMISVIPLSQINLILVLGVIGIGVITGVIASAISVRKYLKA